MTNADALDRYAGITPEAIRDLETKYLFPTYSRYNLCISHGAGAYIYDLQGKRYLDLLAGIAVNCLGYRHPRITAVLAGQAERIIHCSNLFYHAYQGLLAERLCRVSGMARGFFTNSGTEAVEAALKIARAYGHACGGARKSRILTLKNSFHGRTFGALSITAQEKYQAPFRPLVPDVAVIEDLTADALDRAFDERVCALVLEPVQGEGGIVPIPSPFLQAARERCTRHNALLVFDEIQSGMGRTGRYFAFQHCGIEPDLLTVAKALAAGYPLGAVLGNERVAESLKPGEHGTTFGGGPLACRLALEILDVIEEEQLLPRVAALGLHLRRGLEGLAARHSTIGEIRGLGLMLGVELGAHAKEAVSRLLDRGYITNAAHETVLRLLPPFIINEGQIDEFLAALDDTLAEIEAAAR